jgi:Zn-finger nucleic acid-binding protein
MESLTCPKCQGAMRTYERSGVTIDQCTECRGIFLDRGELERLIDADARFHAESAPAAPAPPPPVHQQPRGYEQQRGYDSHHYDDSPDKRYGDDRYYGSKRKKKKRSIFEDLFE